MEEEYLILKKKLETMKSILGGVEFFLDFVAYSNNIDERNLKDCDKVIITGSNWLSIRNIISSDFKK